MSHPLVTARRTESVPVNQDTKENPLGAAGAPGWEQGPRTGWCGVLSLGMLQKTRAGTEQPAQSRGGGWDDLQRGPYQL